MYYVILEKTRSTNAITVHSVYEDERAAVDMIETLIDEGNDNYSYRMDAVPSGE